MVAILDLHWTSPGAYAAVASSPCPMRPLGGLLAVGRYTFQPNPAVIYDLFNEPFLYGNYFTNPTRMPGSAGWTAAL